MANNNNNNGEQAENKNSKKMVFITSIDDDNHNILSCLNSKNVEAIVVNLSMRKDFILTPEEKQLKKQRLEENRRLSSAVINNNIKSENIIEPITINQNNALLDNTRSHSSTFLTEADRSCLSHIQNAYFSASQSTPSASSVISLELASDKMSTFMNTIDIQNFIAIKLINFLREIPEFAQLDDDDRLILVKYNLTLLFVIRYSLNFDSAREIFYDVDTGEPVSPSEEAFAQYCKSLFILCYGYEFNRIAMSIFHALTSIVNKDPIITQLLMLIMIFSKGLSANDDQEPLLNDEKRVFYAQSKYTDLLFRYLMEQSSFEVVIIKMTHIIQQLLKIQKISRDFRQYIKSNVDLTHVNPLMKSLLHLT
ncbi:unnamed protein product [Rotaria sp. Silwood1]|nr:unnamed protein product [Rotaria sp. Silwood1]